MLLASVGLVVFFHRDVDDLVLVQISEQVDAHLGVGTFHLDHVEEIHFLTAFIFDSVFLVLVAGILILVVLVLLVVFIVGVLVGGVTLGC